MNDRTSIVTVALPHSVVPLLHAAIEQHAQQQPAPTTIEQRETAWQLRTTLDVLQRMASNQHTRHLTNT